LQAHGCWSWTRSLPLSQNNGRCGGAVWRRRMVRVPARLSPCDGAGSRRGGTILGRIGLSWWRAVVRMNAGRGAGILIVYALRAAAALPAFGQARAKLRGHAKALAAVAYSADGKYLAT